MKLLDTASRQGMKVRRYSTVDDRVVVTYEVPASVLRGIGTTRLKMALATWKRGEQRRIRAAQMRAHVAANIDVKPTALADQLGITEARVRQIRQELRA